VISRTSIPRTNSASAIRFIDIFCQTPFDLRMSSMASPDCAVVSQAFVV